MEKCPLAKLFDRHFQDAQTALERFRRHLALAQLNFEVESKISQEFIVEQASFPRNMPSSIFYFIPGTGFGSIKKTFGSSAKSSHLFSSDGIGLNMGCPIRLARALEVLFSLKLEDRHEPLALLKYAPTHLAGVEELLWLTLWKAPSGFARGGELVNAKTGCKAKDVDWFLLADQLPIFLEVKFRPVDWMRLSDQDSGHIGRSFFDDIGSKFPAAKPVSCRCVVGITGFAEPDDSFFFQCEKKLLATPGLSAVMYRSLLGPILIASLDPQTTLDLATRVREPEVHEYPLYYRIGFNRKLQEQRLAALAQQKFPEKGLLYCAYVPAPAPVFRPEFPQRFKVEKWSTDGQPVFEHVPPFLTKGSAK